MFSAAALLALEALMKIFTDDMELIPAGMIAAFVLKLPVMMVYFIISMDEMVKMPTIYIHYKKYKWLKNLTQNTNNI